MSSNAKEVIFENSKGLKLFGLVDKPEGSGPFPLLIYVHGFGGRTIYSPEITEGIDKFVENGFAVFRFDASGFNKSEGNYFDITISEFAKDLKSAVDFISKKDFVDKSRISLFGKSLGVLVSALYYAEYSKNVKSMILASGDYDFIWPDRHKKEMDEISERGFFTRYDSGPDKNMEVSKNFVIDGRNHDFKKMYSSLKCPVLLCYGDQDWHYKSYSHFVELLTTEVESLILDGEKHKIQNIKKMHEGFIEFLIKHAK